MFETLVEFKNVSYKVNDVQYLKNISFILTKGKNLVLFGVENSGVDQLIQLILHLDMNYEGVILFKGKNIKELAYREILELSSHMGYIHGEYGLLSNLSVMQNILLPLDYHMDIPINDLENSVKDIIEQLNLTNCINHRPIHLTRAEILKTAYARAIATNPDIVISDHAYIKHSPMDTITTLKHMKEWAKSNRKSLIISTYDPKRFIAFGDSFIMLHQGEIVYKGSKEDFRFTANPYILQYINPSFEGPMKIS